MSGSIFVLQEDPGLLRLLYPLLSGMRGGLEEGPSAAIPVSGVLLTTLAQQWTWHHRQQINQDEHLQLWDAEGHNGKFQ